MSSLQVAEVLEKAADLYESEQYEWCQMTLAQYDKSPVRQLVSLCASGALAIASGYWDGRVTNSDLTSAYQDAYNALKWAVLEKADGFTVEGWNDRANRTKQEVIDTMKETAKGIRNAHSE